MSSISSQKMCHPEHDRTQQNHNTPAISCRRSSSMLGSKSLPRTSVLQVSLTVSEMSRSSVRPIMSLISNLRSLSSRLSWVVAERDAEHVRLDVHEYRSAKLLKVFSRTDINGITYPVHAPKAAEPPLHCSLMVQLPAQKQTLPPGPERIQS